MLHLKVLHIAVHKEFVLLVTIFDILYLFGKFLLIYLLRIYVVIGLKNFPCPDSPMFFIYGMIPYYDIIRNDILRTVYFRYDS